jgi:methionine synthase II (cobalamin-independent)
MKKALTQYYPDFSGQINNWVSTNTISNEDIDSLKKNLEIIQKKDLEDNQKKLGAGFISNLIVEDEKTALQRLTKISEIAGSENIVYLHPDCGFGITPYQNVRQILESMKKASDAFIQSISSPVDGFLRNSSICKRHRGRPA